MSDPFKSLFPPRKTSKSPKQSEQKPKSKILVSKPLYGRRETGDSSAENFSPSADENSTASSEERKPKKADPFLFPKSQNPKREDPISMGLSWVKLQVKKAEARHQSQLRERAKKREEKAKAEEDRKFEKFKAEEERKLEKIRVDEEKKQKVIVQKREREEKKKIRQENRTERKTARRQNRKPQIKEYKPRPVITPETKKMQSERFNRLCQIYEEIYGQKRSEFLDKW